MLFNLLALATLAVLGSVAPGPTTALSVESHNFVRNGQVPRHHHAAIARRQTTSRARRCRARDTSSPASSTASSTTSTSSSSSSSSSTVATTTSAAAATTSKAASSSSSTSKTTSKSTATAAPAQNYAGSAKACITYTGDVDVPKFVSGSNKVACVMNWSSWKPEWMGQIKDAQFVPMYWGSKQNADLRKNVVAGFAKYVLGMNEPNQDGQSKMEASDGAALWKQYIQPLKSEGYTLVSPAPTNADSGLTWLQSFIEACDGCTVDHIAAHWYGTDPDNLISHLTTYHNTFNRPIWLTEYACQDFSGRNQQCSSDQTWAFMEKTQNFLDNTSWIFRYAYFGALPDDAMGGVSTVNKLINSDSSPTALGRKYLGI